MNRAILNDLDVHPRIIAAARKAGFSNSWRILEFSLGELKNKTDLSTEDAGRLMTAAAQLCSPSYVTGLKLAEMMQFPNFFRYIKTGCSGIDKALGGGVPCRGLTELAGESGSGKTQLALQLALQSQVTGDCFPGKSVVYICTETQFPVKRLHQLCQFRKNEKSFNGKSFADNIFVHHLPDMDQLVDCVRYQLPHFVGQKDVGCVIIDSVAAVFRSSEEKQEVKSKAVQQLGFLLRRLSDTQKVAVLAVNQVVSVISDNTVESSGETIVPALGLSWSNLVTTRLMLRKTPFTIQLGTHTESTPGPSKAATDLAPTVRSLEVIFCPWLPRSCAPFVITEEGIKDVDSRNMSLPVNDENLVRGEGE